MERQGVTKEELAKRLGCAATNVGQILLHSNPGLRISTVERLVGALGFDLEVRFVARETTGESGE